MPQETALQRIQKLAGVTSPVSPPPVPGIGDGPETALGRIRQHLNAQPLGFTDAFKELGDGKWKEKTPFFGGAVTAEKYATLWAASDRLERGVQTRDDEDLLLAFLAESQREQGIGYMVGSILTDLPGFAIEFWASGGLWSVGKTAGLKLAGKGLKEAVERAARKSSLRVIRDHVAQGAAGKALGAGAAALGRAAVNTTGQVAAMNLMGEAAGGSRIRANAWRRALPEMRLTEEDAGRLAITFESTAGDFYEQLPKAIADEWIEVLSERSGGALMAGAAKVPGMAQIAAMQGRVAAWWAAKYPGKMGKLLTTVAQKGGWHGPLSEYLEERFGGALRGATGVEEGGLLENAFPSWEQQAAELIAFSVPTAGAMALTGVTSRPEAAEHEDRGLVVQDLTGREPATDEAVEAKMAELGQLHGVDIVRSEASSDEQESASGFAADRGVEVVYVQSADGERLPFDGAAVAPGTVMIDSQAEASASAILVEELFHDLKRRDPELHDELVGIAAEGDQAGFDAFLADYEARFEETMGFPLAEAKRGTEGLGNYAQAHAALVYLGATKKGRDNLARLAQNNRNALEVFRDWLVSGMNALGANLRDTQRRRLDALDAYLLKEEPTTAEAIKVSLVLGEALEVMVGPSPSGAQVEPEAEESRFSPGSVPADPESAGSETSEGKETTPEESLPIGEEGAAPVSSETVETGEAAPTEDAGRGEPPPAPQETLPEDKEPSAPESKPVQDRPELAKEEEGGRDSSKGTRERLDEGEDLSKLKLDGRDAEEAAEMATVLAAKNVVQQGASEGDTFDALVDLYKRQPRMQTRTSTTILKQQFSTPAPLAYVAGKIVGIDQPDAEVFEPTGGHGMLLTAMLDLRDVIFNELDSDRYTRVSNALPIGTMASYDAAAIAPFGEYNTVIANPPFGTVRGEDGKARKFTYRLGKRAFQTGHIDHAIVAKSLEQLPDDGRAVFIIGSQKSLKAGAEARQAARKKAYGTGQKRIFFRELYENWNVVHHVTISGDLYKSQGATWPVDVIVIDGRGASSLERPAVEPPRTLETWDEVKDLLVSARLDPRPRRSVGSEGRDPERSGVSRPDDLEGGDAGAQGRGEPGEGPGGEVSGAGRPGADSTARAASDRPSGATGRGSASGATSDRGGDVAGEGGEALPAPADDVRGVAPGLDSDADLGALFDAELDAAFDDREGLPTPDDHPGFEYHNIREIPGTKPKPAPKPPKDEGEQALDDIADLFSLPRFDKAKYEKIKPAFKTRLAQQGIELGDRAGIVGSIIGYFKDTLHFTKEKLANLKQYVVQFIKDTQAGLITWGGQKAIPQEVKPSRASEAVATDTQIAYEKRSNADPLDTLIPSNMQTAVREALGLIERDLGVSVDEYVMEEMGWSFEEMRSYLGGEQVDAVALGIYAMQKGRGFVLGDQTGVGKGRVVASFLEWARRNGKIPVFFTRKPGLFKDMGRDLADIGVTDFKPMVTNRSNWANLEMPDGSTLKKIPESKYEAAMRSGISGTMPKGYDSIFTTYSQFTSVNGVRYARHMFMEGLASNSVWIMDESHEAGGQDTGDRAPDANKLPVSVWMRDLLREVSAAAFSSATFAKNPQAMTLYERTDLGLAFRTEEGESDPGALKATVITGGLPIQQAISNLLAESGQMVRRERSFEGVDFGEKDVDVDLELSDRLSGVLSSLFDLDLNRITRVRKDFVTEILPGLDGEAFSDSGVGSAGAEAGADVGFGSVMHNLVAQALLSLKAAKVADQAIEEWRAGRKPVISFNFTLGAALKRYADRNGLVAGDVVPDASFRSALHEAVERMRRITLKDPNDPKGPSIGHVRIEDEHFEELGYKGALEAISEALTEIDSLDLGDMSISPVDVMVSRMRDAGMVAEELTGRSLVVDFSGPEPKLASRKGTDAANNARIAGFNAGSVDVLLFNTVGSTGFSMHAGPKFLDQRRRVMLIAEFNPDINVFKQTLGRIHRTGQVEARVTEAVEGRSVVGREFDREEYGLPIFRMMFSTIPVEQRQKAMLRSKMAALNANTTATLESGDTLEGTPAFLNKYGDQVALDVLQEMDVADVRIMALDRFLLIDAADENAARRAEKLASKLTNKLMLLPHGKQKSVLDRLVGGYIDLIDHLNAIGENDLEAQLEELDARRLSVKEVEPADGPSPFQRAVLEERLDVKRLRPPIPFQEMLDQVEPVEAADMLSGINEELPAALEAIAEQVAQMKPAIAEASDRKDAAAAEVAEAQAEYDRANEGKKNKDKRPNRLIEAGKALTRAKKELRALERRNETIQVQGRSLQHRANELTILIERLRPGATVLVEGTKQNSRGEDAETETTFGVVTHFERRGRTASALAASDYVFTLRTAAVEAPIRIPASRLISRRTTLTPVPESSVRDVVEAERASGRQEVSILTGNMPRAWSRFGLDHGRIVMYRDSAGNINSGVLLRDGANVREIMEARPIPVGTAAMGQLLATGKKFSVQSEDGAITVAIDQRDASIRVGQIKGYKRYIDAFDRVGVEFERRPRQKFWAPKEYIDSQRVIELTTLVNTRFLVAEADKAAARTALGIEIPDLREVDFSIPRKGRRVVHLRFDSGKETRLDRIRRKAQDKDIRFKRFQEAVLRAKGKITDDTSVYGAIEAYPGKVEAQMEDWEDNVLLPILKLVGENKIDLDDLDLFLYARHAPERNELIAKKNLDRWRADEIKKIRTQAKQAATRAQAVLDDTRSAISGGDLTAEELVEAKAKVIQARKDIVRNLRVARAPALALPPPPADLPFQDVENAPGSGMPTKTAEGYLEEYLGGEKGEVYAQLGELVDAMNRETRETQQGHSLISEKTRALWDEQYEHYVPLRTSVEPGRELMGQRFDTRHSVTREAWGRRSYAHSPFGYSVVQARKAIVYGNKNQIGLTLLRLIGLNKKMLDEQFKVRELEEALDEDGEMIPRESVPGTHEFGLRRNGKEVYVRIEDPLLLRSLQGLGDQHPGPVVRLFAKINRYLAMMSTSLDPGFMFGNFTRDLEMAGITLSGEQGGKLARRVVMDTLSGAPVKAAWRGLRGKPEAGNEWDEAFAALRESGGVTGWFYMRDFEGEVQSLSRQMADFSPSRPRQAYLMLQRVGQRIEDMNRAVENGVRLAAFKRAREAGMSTAQASSLAKNLTVNFNRRGEWGQVMNALYLFYNASVQGSIRVLQALKHPRVRRIVLGMTTASALLDMVNRAIGDDDEDGVPFYDKIPQWVKGRNLILMIPGSGGNYVKIPLPWGYSVFHVAGQQASSAVAGVVTTGQAAVNILSEVSDSFFPLGGEQSIVQRIMPTLADPMIQLAANETFYGGPIRPTPYGEPSKPRSQLFWNSVNPNLRDFAVWLNEITGGDAIEPGGVDVSPEDLEHAFGFAMGGVGRQLKRGWDLGAKLGAGETSPIRDVPIVRRFVGQPDERYDRELFVEQRNEVRRAQKQFEEYRGEPERMKAIVEEKRNLLRLVPTMKAVESRLRKIRKARRLAMDAGLKDRVKQLDEQAKKIQAAFSKKYRETIAP